MFWCEGILVLTRSVSEGILGENKQPKPLADASGYKVSAIGRQPSESASSALALISEDQCSEFPPLHVVIDGRESVGLRSHQDGFVPEQVLTYFDTHESGAR